MLHFMFPSQSLGKCDERNSAEIYYEHDYVLKKRYPALQILYGGDFISFSFWSFGLLVEKLMANVRTKKGFPWSIQIYWLEVKGREKALNFLYMISCKEVAIRWHIQQRLG